MDTPDPIERIAGALGVLLMRQTRASLYERLTASIENVDETLYPVLSGLARLGPATPTELADAVGLDRSVVTRHSARLEAVGLISRSPHPDDRRASVLTLTAAGRDAIAQSRAALHAVLRDVTAQWGPSDVATLAGGLERLLADLGRHTAG